MKKGMCKKGEKCQFAHNFDEIKKLNEKIEDYLKRCGENPSNYIIHQKPQEKQAELQNNLPILQLQELLKDQNIVPIKKMLVKDDKKSKAYKEKRRIQNEQLEFTNSR